MYESGSSSLRSTIDRLDECLNKWQAPISGNSALLYSGYDGSGLTRLRELWRTWFGDEEPDAVFGVSPFFDKDPGNGCFADELCGVFPSIDDIAIATAYRDAPEQFGSFLCKRHFGPLKDDAPRSLWGIPQYPDANEKKDIASEAVEMAVEKCYGRRGG